jgi:predicted esterase
LIEERWVTASFHGRILRVAADPARALVGFHGYGENAERSLEAMERIPGAIAWTRVAVQAPHPFYDRRGEQVLASWMTRQGRDHAIADNIAYVRAAVRDALAPTPDRLVFVGFSQGVAMAYRAAARAGLGPSGLIVLGADVPPELDAGELAALPPILLGRGRAEEWYSAAKLAADRDRLTAAGARLRVIEFDGGHEWGRAFLEAAGAFLAGTG